MFDKLSRGDVICLYLDPVIGAEIRDFRPAIVVSADQFNANPVNSIVIVVPLAGACATSRTRTDEVVIESLSSGLRERGVTVSNQVRAVDRQRIKVQLGHISVSEMAKVDQCLQRVLALV